MAGLEIEIDTTEAEALLDELPEKLDRGVQEALVRGGMIASEAISSEAPTGAGTRGGHLSDSVEARFVGPKKVEVQPRKRTGEGWLLHRAIVGNPSTPSYSSSPPPIQPLREWAAAVLGDADAAYGIQQSIFRSGHTTFPNPFIDRGFMKSKARIERTSENIIEGAIS